MKTRHDQHGQASSDAISERAYALLSLVLLPGLGPIRASRLLDAFGGDADRVLDASPDAWCAVQGIGPVTTRRAREGLGSVRDSVEQECDRILKAGAQLIAFGDEAYPELLRELPDAPRLLYVKGTFGRIGRGTATQSDDVYPVAIVGSRRCTQYGVEQAERFGGVLARSGLTVVSGGARGIDTAAHRGALRSGGRTAVVLGCGLSCVYPPENAELFSRIVEEGRGALVSELPMLTEPRGEHFPARNRIISGLSLGVVVIEASRKSGALITAAVAAEEHGREVMILPGRVDSPSSAGSLDLLKRGGGALVVEPGDVLDLLEAPARFAHEGTHAARYADPAESEGSVAGVPDLFGGAGEGVEGGDACRAEDAVVLAIRMLGGDGRPVTFDRLVLELGWPSPKLRTSLTLLELSGAIARAGSGFRVPAR